MTVQAVSEYINEVLQPQLANISSDKKYVQLCCEQVEMRMLSLLSHWNDEHFRNAVLITAEDEAAFCAPSTAKKEIKEFIIATVRNSPIEIMHSEKHCIHAGLGRPLSDKQMSEIISKAIRTWNKQRMNLLAEQAQECEFEDYYANLAEKYPLAWNALSTLGGIRKASETFEPVIPLEPFFMPETPQGKEEEGFSDYIEEAKSNALAASRTLGYIYKTDSFSVFSRNPEALLTGMEYLFTRGGKFVTTNYYVSNVTVQRRIPLREPAHNADQAEKNLKSTKGISELHAKALATSHGFN